MKWAEFKERVASLDAPDDASVLAEGCDCEGSVNDIFLTEGNVLVARNVQYKMVAVPVYTTGATAVDLGDDDMTIREESSGADST